MSAFAQSTVTISGSLDFAAMHNGKITTTTNAGAETVIKNSQTSQYNSWTTNQISFSGTEDLGGGTKASFTVNQGTAAATTSTLGSRDTFLALENAKMGKVQLGRFVAASSVGFHSLSGSASTAVGSLYGMLTPNAATGDRFSEVNATQMTAGNFERGDNKVQYTSPSFNGLTFNVNTSKAQSDETSAVAAKAGDGITKQSGVGLNYASGPLTLGFGTNTRNVDLEAAAPNQIKGKLNWLGASYDLGVATVYGTRLTRKDATTVVSTGVETINFNAKITQMGVKVPMGQYTFSASTYSGKDTRTAADADNVKLAGRQLSVQYAMSKRTSIYALTGLNKITRDADAGTANNRKETVSMVGLLHTF